MGLSISGCARRDARFSHARSGSFTQGSVGREFLLRVAYMELYNEDINDLLAPESGKLQVMTGSCENGPV